MHRCILHGKLVVPASYSNPPSGKHNHSTTPLLQEHRDVARDSVTPDGQPAYWTSRYQFRGAVTSTGSGAAAGFDVPDFLASSKEAILVTGGLTWHELWVHDNVTVCDLCLSGA